MFKLYDVVRLKKNDEQRGVLRSYLGAIVDVLPSPDGGVYTVEFINDQGETIEEALFTDYKEKELELVKPFSK